MTASASPPMVLVAVGTDHHRFDRLVDWVDRWAEAKGPKGARVLVQYGSAAAPVFAEGHPLLDHATLQGAMEEADIVVCHGGPATIAEARRHGHLPICVPRDPARGEHVDGHQQLFARRMGSAGIVALAEGEAEFTALLGQALAEPNAFRVEPDSTTGQLPGTVEVGRILADLVGSAPISVGAEPDRTLEPAPQPEPRVSVLFVAGLGRSGSTLVERLASQLPGHVGVGESVHLWERSLVDDELCGCGEPFSRCPFWSKVGDIAFGGWDQLDVIEVQTLKATVDRTRYVPALVAPRSTRFNERLTHYNELLTKFYRAVRQVSGADVIVDASKHASLLHVLRHNTDLDLRVLHVVRDSPAVAYSWTKTVSRPESTGSLDYMETWKPAHTARQWMAENSLVELASMRGVPTLRVRYEDFTADPEGTLREVQRFSTPHARAEPLGFISDDRAELTESHTVAGNPMRFRNGELHIRKDDAWQRELPTRDRLVVESLTSALRWRYGYLKADPLRRT